MNSTARRFLTAGILLVLVPAMLSGCIVVVDDIFHDNRPTRAASLHVYVRDYYSGAPIHWAQVELWESHWWNWDYQGTWPASAGGYVRVPCGYFYPDGSGGGDYEDFRVVVYASGYSAEAYEIGLSYYYPSETLTFYLMPYGAKAAGDGATGDGVTGDGVDSATESSGERVGPDTGPSLGRVELGASSDGVE